ncbi:MAG: hypothetical protein R2932_00530 [Caldilineaceae bacterium]
MEAIVEETFHRNGYPDAGIRIVATGGPADDFDPKIVQACW